MSENLCWFCHEDLTDAERYFTFNDMPYCNVECIMESKFWTVEQSDQVKVVRKKVSDPVNAPSHYTFGGIETIDYLKAKMSSEMYEGFLLGNVLKYTSRYREKNGRQDLEKARWYLNKLLEDGSK